METCIAFLLNQQPDKLGRTVQQYLGFAEMDWEFQHDVIQMAFPTKTQSAYHPDQPFLPSDFDIKSLAADEQQRCKATISLLLHSYLKSLGVEFLSYGNENVKHSFTLTRTSYPAWADSRDHNTLRLTRILECLGIFEMYDTQQALFEFLMFRIAAVFHTRVNTKTVAFWVAAKENKLHLLR